VLRRSISVMRLVASLGKAWLGRQVKRPLHALVLVVCST
jgi:hypothetical protein